MNKYIPIIGLEVHVELRTKSKMFCQCEANHFGREPNSQICPVCLGLPGALPVPNRKAIEWTQLIGAALNCQINKESKFDRKHYFYPDLPKGYQISQYDEPFCTNGYLQIEETKFGIRRVHLEEDTGKLVHQGNDTLIDFNRSGVPLVEIVTEPDFHDSEDVKRFLEELHTVVRYLGVSDADMEKGSMRLEPNISVKNEKLRVKNELPNYKVEVKNINSFRFVKLAIDYEIERQIEILNEGKTPEQETRGFDEKKNVTYQQRSKEEAQDYRYFPEPDIPPLQFTESYVNGIQSELPELPQAKMQRYISDLKLRPQDAYILTRDKDVVDFFEKNLKQNETAPFAKSINVAQYLANLIINKRISPDKPVNLGRMLAPKETDEKLLDSTIKRLIESNKKAIDDFKAGKQNALMFLVGQVMREMKGKADAKIVIERIKKLI